MQAEQVVARQVWRPVVLQRSRTKQTHLRRAAQQLESEMRVARPAWRFAAGRRLRAEARHWMRAVRQQAQPNSLDWLVPARLLPRPGRLCRCWPNQVPCAFYRATLADRKCNRAVRSADHPILAANLERRRARARCRKRHNLGGAVRCGNRSNRSRRKRVGRVRPFPISALDKCRCLLRHSADRDGQSANRECKQAPARKRQGSRGFQERAE